MRRKFLTALFGIALCLLLAGESTAKGGDSNRKITTPVRDAVKIRQDTQKAEEQWREDEEKLVALYENLQAEQTQLKATRKALQADIQGAQGRIVQKEKQLADIQQISTQIEPFLTSSIEALKKQIEDGLPFLPEERRKRIERLGELMADPDVAISEKYRKVMEALMVEAEYGNTIEVYQETIQIEAHEMLVNIFRLGRISLLYQTLDKNRCGFFNIAEQGWEPLPETYNRAIGTAIDIGTKRKPAELLSLPLGRISKK